WGNQQAIFLILEHFPNPTYGRRHKWDFQITRFQKRVGKSFVQGWHDQKLEPAHVFGNVLLKPMKDHKGVNSFLAARPFQLLIECTVAEDMQAQLQSLKPCNRIQQDGMAFHRRQAADNPDVKKLRFKIRRRNRAVQVERRDAVVDYPPWDASVMAYV